MTTTTKATKISAKKVNELGYQLLDCQLQQYAHSADMKAAAKAGNVEAFGIADIALVKQQERMSGMRAMLQILGIEAEVIAEAKRQNEAE